MRSSATLLCIVLISLVSVGCDGPPPPNMGQAGDSYETMPPKDDVPLVDESLYDTDVFGNRLKPEFPSNRQPMGTLQMPNNPPAPAQLPLGVIKGKDPNM